MLQPPSVQIAGHDFRVERATYVIELRPPEQCRSMRVSSPNLSFRVDLRGREVPTRAYENFWTPRIYSEALPWSHFVDASWSRPCLPMGRWPASIYLLRHRTIQNATFEIAMRDREAWLHLTGQTLFAAIPGDHEELPIEVATPLRFDCVRVYTHDVDAARAMLDRVMDSTGLSPMPPTISEPGRRKYLLFGPIEGRMGSVAFVPDPPPR